MPIEVTARHMEASDALLEYAREKGEQILDEFPRVENLHIVLNVEKKRQIAEMVIQAKNHIRLESAETSDNMRMSIDGVSDKLVRKLRQLRDKVQDHRAAKKHGEARRNIESELVT